MYGLFLIGSFNVFNNISFKTLQFSFFKSLKKQEILSDNTPRHGASRHKKNFLTLFLSKGVSN